MKTGRKRKLSIEKSASSVKTGTEAKKRQQMAKEATTTATVQDASTSRRTLPLTTGRSSSSVKTGTKPKKRQQITKKASTTATAKGTSTSRKALPLTKGRSASSVVTAKDPTTQKKERKTTIKGTPSVIDRDSSSKAEALPSRDTPIAFKCSICLDTTCHKRMKRLLCSHEFHEVCVDEWLRRNTSCPYCRKALAPPPPPPRWVNRENEVQRFERLQVEILLLGNDGRNVI